MLVLPPVSVLLEILPAAAVAGAVCLAALRPWRGRGGEPGPAERAGAAIAMSAGLLAAFLLMAGRLPPWPSLDLDVSEWPFHAAVLAGAVGAVLSLRPPGPGARAALGAALAGLLAFLILRPVGTAGTMAVAAIAGLGAWLGLDGLAARRRGAAVPLAMLLVAGGGAQALAHAHYAKGAQLAGGLSAAAGAVVALALVFRRVTVARGGTLVFTLLAGSLWLLGAFYADLPPESAVALAAAPLGAWVGEVPFLARRPAVLRLLVTAAAVAAPVLFAVHRSLAANPPDPYGYF